MSSDASSLLSVKAVVAVVVRPHLWATAIKQAVRLAPRGWWRHAPFLPIPRKDYLEFRTITQYGGGHGIPSAPAAPRDVVDYLEWCRQWNKSS